MALWFRGTIGVLVLTAGALWGVHADADQPVSIFGQNTVAGVSVLSDEALDQQKGMGTEEAESLILSSNSLVSSAAGDISAETMSSGNLSIGGSALQNFSGMNNMVINSGQGSSVQGSLSVNVILN